MLLAADPVFVFAARVERIAQQRRRPERELVQTKRFLGDLEEADALDIAGRAR
jgi:hypothetical protein